MRNKIDNIMLASLLVLLLLASWINRSKGPLTAPKVVVEEENAPIEVVPDFATITDVKAKKQAFFGYLQPFIEAANGAILQTRNQVLGLSAQVELSLSEREWLFKLAKEYRLSHPGVVDETFFHQLLMRVDTIPPSLALAQSANESAWGTSRFARQGNNFFGQWCFKQGCGLVPGARPEGKIYEVQKFADVEASVKSYMHNLNTNHQYEAFRELRLGRRKYNKPIIGTVLAHGLHAYSIRGGDYVDELVLIINSNKLLQYDLYE